MKYTKDLLIHLLIMFLSILFIPITQIWVNLKEVWESSHYFKNVFSLYQKLIPTFKEYKENDFDMNKVNKARRKRAIDSQFSQAQVVKNERRKNDKKL